MMIYIKKFQLINKLRVKSQAWVHGCTEFSAIGVIIDAFRMDERRNAVLVGNTECERQKEFEKIRLYAMQSGIIVFRVEKRLCADRVGKFLQVCLQCGSAVGTYIGRTSPPETVYMPPAMPRRTVVAQH